jgi:two-component system, cell cycle sensor histidine kinase and response regulator CckA
MMGVFDLRKSKRAQALAISVILCGALVIDLATPRGYGDWVLYVLAIVFAMRLAGRRAILAAAALASVFMLLGLGLSPPGAPVWICAYSRSLGLILVWALVWIAFQWRRSEEKLTRLQKAVDGSNEVVFMTDAQGVITFINPAFTETYGYREEEVIGKTTPRILKGGQVAPETYKAFWEMLLAKRSVQGEFINKTKDGRLISIDAAASAILDARGKITGFLGLQRDITERKQAEAALRVSEIRYRRLFEAAKDGILILDHATGSIVDVNPFLEGLLGYPSRRLLGEKIWDLGFQRDAAASKLMFKELQDKGQVRYENLPLQTRKGLTAEVEFVSNVYEVDGRKVIQCNIRDITERVKVAKELEKSQEQFLQAQKMEAVGRLAGGIAHDFNNLLTVINGYSDLILQSASPDDPHRRHLEEVKRAGERAAGLTRQLLAFSRKQVVMPTVLDLNAVVKGMQNMMQRLICEDVEFVVNFAKPLGPVKADAGQIEQVIMNLVVNARDAMPRGGKLTIETANVDLDESYAAAHAGVAPGKYVMLALSDSGCGMDEETQSHIFEPFYTTKEQGKGTGLGLSTVYGIVKQSGGHVSVSSEVGRGTMFKVYLRRMDEPGAADADESGNSIPVSGTETILLVEDEPGVRSLVQKTLRANGYAVLAAGGAVEAQALAARHAGTIHLLLTDVIMPGLNGKELAERLHALRPDMRVLFISGFTSDAIAQHGILDEGVAFLPKPFTPLGLLLKVRRTIDGRADDASLPRSDLDLAA